MRKTKNKIISLTAAIMLIFTAAAPAFAAKTDKVKTPDINAEGVVVYCQNTGEIIYGKNQDKKIAPYSITKLMTAFLAAQNLPLEKEVTVSAEAAGQTEASMELKEGEVLTVKDLIYGALLPSGNDAAYALGEAVSGNMDDFVDLMNKTADNLGCKNTNFVNPNGMDSKNHYTTAYDMMLITKTALSNEIVAKASGAGSYTVGKTNKSDARKLKSHLGFDSDSGVYGGKTGYWDDYNCSIALGYKKDGLHLYIVLLGASAEERSKDVKKLIQYATEKVEGLKVVGKDENEGKVRIKHGAKTRLKAYTAETGYAYLPKEASKELISTEVVMRSDVEAPVKKGDVVGSFQIYVADDLVNEVDLIIKEDVETGWFPSYLGISNLATVIICVVALLLFTFFVWISVMRARYRRRKKQLRKQKVMQIAMEQMRREQEHKERDWRF